MTTSDAILIKGCIEGERKFQNQLYQQYKSYLFATCLRYAKDHAEAQDMLQDGFVKIFTKLYTYQPTGPLLAWMRKVVVNTALEHLRKRKLIWADVPMEQLEEATEDDDDDLDFVEERAQVLIQLIQQLPDGYRAVFNLNVMEGYTHAEIAEILEISENTSRTQLFKAKKNLRKLLENQLTN